MSRGGRLAWEARAAGGRSCLCGASVGLPRGRVDGLDDQLTVGVGERSDLASGRTPGTQRFVAMPVDPFGGLLPGHRRALPEHGTNVGALRAEQPADARSERC